MSIAQPRYPNHLTTFTNAILAALLLAFLVACSETFPVGNGRSDPDLIFQDVTAIDALNGVRRNVDVTIVDGRIADVGVDLAGASSETSQIIDGSGKFLIPGLWDAHVHLAYDPGIDYRTFFPLSLAYGVTYLRDTGGHLDRLDAARKLAASDAITPDLYVSGPLIDGPKRIYAGQASSFPNLSIGVADEAEAIAAVDQLAAQQVDFIKAYELLSPEAFAAIIARAEHHGLPVTGHSPLSMTAKQVITAGINDMQHLRNLEFDCVSDPVMLLDERNAQIAADTNEFGAALRLAIHRHQRSRALQNSDPAVCAALIAAMRDNAVSQTPTLTISRFLSRKLHAEERWQSTFALMPQPIAARWQAGATRLAEREVTDNDRAYDAWLLKMVRDMNSAGVSILAGTDAPIGYLTPGISLHEELAMLVEAGMTPLDALRAATIAPAAFLGLEDQQGSIAAGMKADLVLLNANPLLDIRNTTSINGVVRNGNFLDRSSLDALRIRASNLKQ